MTGLEDMICGENVFLTLKCFVSKFSDHELMLELVEYVSYKVKHSKFAVIGAFKN